MSKDSWLQMTSKNKKSKEEMMGYKRSINTSRSGGPERKRSKGPIRQGDKRRLPASAHSSTHSSILVFYSFQYNLRPRIKKAAESRPSRGEMQDQGGPVRSRGRRFQESRPYSKKNTNYKQQTRRQSRQEQEQELTSG
ncbi:hypothetical protein TNIN_237271 [Trichonephila inaurata madagascariensis]|uniref:Uncharacterized protein n=1 Tax=Trichonephila inaurata madagascariensis TaxID=2747483 RepID=A0A8X6XNP3_9ARAC|nr:hypothetical protein TNIN_237271 [Trichonephila inaurata madagascariensis]